MAQVGSDLRHHAPAWLSVRAVVVLTSLTALGAVAFLAAVVVPATGDFAPTTWWLLALFFVVAVVSDVVYVPVRHADAWEELTFVEIVLIWGALLHIEPLQLLAGLPARGVAGSAPGHQDRLQSGLPCHRVRRPADDLSAPARRLHPVRGEVGPGHGAGGVGLHRPQPAAVVLRVAGC